MREHKLDEATLAAESDKSPGVLLASGYIAGGAIAGIVIAFVQGVTTNLDSSITKWASDHNPFFAGPNADWLALIPFVAAGRFLTSPAGKCCTRSDRLPLSRRKRPRDGLRAWRREAPGLRYALTPLRAGR